MREDAGPTAAEVCAGHRRAGLARILLVCFGLIAHAAAQQPQTGQVQAEVLDITGAIIKGASVYVGRSMLPEEQIKLATHTDIQGNFTLVLPEGVYNVLVTASGFAAHVETIAIFVGKTKKVEWKMKALGCDFPGVNCDVFR